MDTTFLNSENRNTSDIHRSVLKIRIAYISAFYLRNTEISDY